MKIYDVFKFCEKENWIERDMENKNGICIYKL